jgi:hypothetical protein
VTLVGKNAQRTRNGTLNLRQQTQLVTMFHTTRQSCWGFPIPPSSPAARVYEVAGLSIIKEDKEIGVVTVVIAAFMLGAASNP